MVCIMSWRGVESEGVFGRVGVIEERWGVIAYGKFGELIEGI